MSSFALTALLLSACAFVAGAVVPFQAASNGLLAKQIGHPLWATLISLFASIIVLLPVLLMLKVPKPAFNIALFQQPVWMWLGGVAGVFYITAALILVPKIGATTFFIMVIAGQLVISTLIDYFGLFGVTKQYIPWGRIGGIGLVMSGVLCIQFFKQSP
ncbi:DMT family transporter [Moellerella wisconsensis]|uniref:DMT family transporter n=1 Tax=Moellerella wisconsensis TaxID=158849 RepID=A0ACD3Y327_9GAMM|nr:DMT family transporter [Moellerella wisconsensis]KLN98060.1 membrane protein [Moellerella wisconsensis]UNH37513.1 DMT family transporter [Moellerella wisconsensis]UNH41060.1 DMT family transporter [Moellerella wisconsensis]